MPDVTVSEVAFFLENDWKLLRDALFFAAIAADGYFIAGKAPSIMTSCERLRPLLPHDLYDVLLDMAASIYNLSHSCYPEWKIARAELCDWRFEIYSILIELDRLYPGAGVGSLMPAYTRCLMSMNFIGQEDAT